MAYTLDQGEKGDDDDETWLVSDIKNSELELDDYEIYRRDCIPNPKLKSKNNDNHRGVQIGIFKNLTLEPILIDLSGGP